MASDGPNSPGTSANVDRDGMQAWDTPSNAEAEDDTYVHIDVTASCYTDWLRVTNFGFSIPVGATIDGILVEINHYCNGFIDEHSCRLVLDGVIQGDEKMTAENGIPVEDLDTYESYGASDDDWNASLNYEDINDSNFGVQVSYNNSHGVQSKDVWVDHIRMTVYYTEAGGSEVYSSKGIARGIGRGVVR